MSSESLRAFLTAKSRECGASWEKESMGFFKQIYAEGEQKEGGRRNKNQKDNHACNTKKKEKKTKQTDRNISLYYIYLFVYTHVSK